MTFIEPSFEIDEKGRVICQSHSKYPQFIKPEKTPFEEMQMETQLTCKTCSHYKNDDCYFPKADIDEIEFDRINRTRFECNFCGNKIDRMLTIMQKIYLEENFQMKMPLICCSCYESLINNKFDEYFKKRIWEALLFYTPVLFSLGNPFPTNLIFAIVSFLGVIILKFIIKQYFHYSLFLIDLLKGKKFYDKNFRDKI
jgi:hypothetical protein